MIIINLDKARSGKLMSCEGDILFNLRNMKTGEKIKVFTCNKDIFDNDSVDVYTIEKEVDGVYISYLKRKSFDESQNIYFKDRTVKVGTRRISLNDIAKMSLTNIEKESIIYNSLELGVIRQGYALEGKFSNGLEFSYPNIIRVEKVMQE